MTISGELISGITGGVIGAGGAMIALTKLLIRAAVLELRDGLAKDFLPRPEGELMQQENERRLARLEGPAPARQ